MTRFSKYLLGVSVAVLSFISCSNRQDMNFNTVMDTPYPAPYAVKFSIPEKCQGAVMYKLVIDDDDNVFALTSNGVYRDYPGNILSKDMLYRSLSDKQPLDITIQAGTGYPYYLYADRYLSNRESGKACAHFSESYNMMAVNEKGEVLLVGASGAALYKDNEKVSDLPLPLGKSIKLIASGETFYSLSSQTVSRLDGKDWTVLFAADDLTSFDVTGSEILVGTKNGFSVLDLKGNVKSALDAKVPVPSITDVQVVDGRRWFASEDGVFVQNEGKYNYFGQQRWLDEYSVKDIAADSKGDIYMLTETGLSKIEFREQTMKEKADYLLTNLRKYHLRFGFSAESDFLEDGDPTSAVLYDSDNDGLWSSFYLGSEALRYAVTGDPDARENAWETFSSFERLISIHEPQWFSSRSFERAGFHAHDEYAWRQAPDPDWEWKGTTSTDEFVGYIFIVALLDEFVVSTDEERERITKYICTVMDHIIENDLYFIDVDGKPTLWGRLNPDYVNSFAHTQFDRMLYSTLYLAGFQEAYKLSGDVKYKDMVEKGIKEFGYLENIEVGINTIKYTPGFRHMGISLGEDWNHSDDEMAFLTYWPLCKYALDEATCEKYLKLVSDHWEIERPEGEGLWNLISYHLCGKIDLDKTIKYLREYPIDCTRYEVRNSHRKDIELIPYDVNTNFREQTTKELLPKNERPVNRHNSNEFRLDNRSHGDSQLAGDEYLLPYWMARYLKVVE